MPSSPDNAAAFANPPPSAGYVYNHHRNRSRGLENLQSRGRNISRYEFGRRDRYGERVTRIYPREITNAAKTTARYSSSPAPIPTTSPLIKALGSTTTTAAHYTNEWTKSLPYFAAQQPASNGRSISGSPPGLTPGQSYGVSPSPPTIGGRPLSHPNHYPSFGGRLQGSPHQSPSRDRRASMFSKYSSQPPLPHEPQSHFYGLPEIDFGLDPPQSELLPGSNGYFCGFDTLDSVSDKPSSHAGQNVLLVGYEGGLDVLDVGRSHMNVLGRIEGLKGAVIGAKILPWTDTADPCAEERPLIALIIHAPVLDGIKDTHNPSGSSSAAGTSENEGSSSPPTRPASVLADNATDVSHYQTTVEIWSMKNGKSVATLYKSALVPVSAKVPLDSTLFQPPPPVGDLRIAANGRFVVVASGVSGEVFVFAPKEDEANPGSFRCIGKVWTTVQVREHTPSSSAASSTEASSVEAETTSTYGVPLFALCEHWLAVVPPASSSIFSTNGMPLLSPSHPKPPGITTHAPPPPPPTTCQVDAPEDSFIGKASREMAQQAMKGMQWAASTGMTAWKNYWNKSEQANAVPVQEMQPPPQPYFPPTHGVGGQAASQPSNEPTLVSIFSLQRMEDAEITRSRNALNPLATFSSPLGCSFLSFSPSGLMLMTFSKKGDNQFVWDLNNLNHNKAGNNPARSSNSHVRQVVKFTRMTIANIIDVSWSSPKGKRLAILTEKGTVHMYPMPASAFQWPPPRRARKPNEQKTKDGADSASNAKNSGKVGSAAQTITGKAIPFLNAVRSRGGGVGTAFSGLSMTPAAGAKGGKAVAAGLGKTMAGAAVNLKHAGDNKLHLPSLANGVNPNSVRWLASSKKKKHERIALVAGGVLTIYSVTFQAVRSRNTGAQTRINKRKLVEYSLNPIRDTRIAPSVMNYLESKPGEEPRPFPGTEKAAESYWTPRAPTVNRDKGQRNLTQPLAVAEIEANTPYQPFHTDRRIDLFGNEEAAPAPQNGEHNHWEEHQSQQALVHHSHVDDATEWSFGEELPSAKLSLPSYYAFEDEDPLADDMMGLVMGGEGAAGQGAAGMMSSLVMKEGDEEVEQVVVTTRRRRNKRKSEMDDGDDEEGFFEDDCEVWDFANDRV
ncbi:uncharacterized protein K452DRAFT_228031 [Aplosporella prunicola CBS 121167]|uniref:BCAS3 domain-containing protein n=1 Tax=Aplosporella prunicola CBS 121167 TaxID=1176127 RepID=A0A6A6BBM1_9PEZI|nr:uncharacterized protein K452DRAFT_228031 [Aplosporella prunicola CBS 121167]KAF2141632.1 hypothetical protein K452DRAFT_228031 [Aplosporella prunicola CBS 121167]